VAMREELYPKGVALTEKAQDKEDGQTSLPQTRPSSSSTEGRGSGKKPAWLKL
jgi:hypothetical protein